MKVVLTEEVKKLGVRGDIREVKDGYARNWLLPQAKAVLFGTQAGRVILAEVAQKRAEKKRSLKKKEKRPSRAEKRQIRQSKKEQKEKKIKSKTITPKK